MKKLRLTIVFVIGCICVLSFVDFSDFSEREGANSQPFSWNQDHYWKSLESKFLEQKNRLCNESKKVLLRADFEQQLEVLESSTLKPNDPRLDSLERDFFELSAVFAACPENVGAYLDLQRRLRIAIKNQSQDWVVTTTTARNRLYRSLLGSRLAVEEVLLQLARTSTHSLSLGREVKSRAPATVVHGVKIHSGDMLASRGGAPSSALVARGNDYPGNFSHIALVHVDEQTKEVSIVESHIEYGVVVVNIETYLKDKKLRIMVLRLREDHPALSKSPMLAHKAASFMKAEASRRHIPYDFEMNYESPDKQFCSEVASAAYAAEGVSLWKGRTSMSGKGVTHWLSLLGVRYFETHGPSELEYDPQISVVAEFRALDTLFQDHVDNAITDALLELAEQGQTMPYSRLNLPVARLAKTYSWVLNQFGKVGPVPEGMSAVTALRVQALNARHEAARRWIITEAETFFAKNGYRPPYWKLVEMARIALRKP